MNHMTLTSRICGIALGLSALTSLAGAATSLAPHRAFYALEAHRIGDTAGITDLSGKLAYEITGNACDGYAVNYRLVNLYSQQGGAPQTVDIRLTSFESGDGTELDLKQKNFVNGKLETEFRVKASKPKDGGEGKGEYSGNETKTFTIAPNILFPTEFQRKLMASAENGTSNTSGIVYEGSEEDKPVRAVSFIGPRRANTVVEKGADAETLAQLSKLPAWPVTVSYYKLETKGDELPSYSASFNMLENGVSTELVLDYGAYAMKGKLEKIEMLKPETCN
jgi:hypothetical protein